MSSARPLLSFIAVALLLAACASPSAQSAKPAAPGVPTVAASGGPAAPELAIELLGKLGLEPAHGSWDTTVTATATGLKAGNAYDLSWTTVNGQWNLSPDRTEFKGRVYAPAKTPLRTVTADAAGAFRTTFVVPQDFGFQHDVLLTDAGGAVIRNKAGFDVDLQVSLSPQSGPVGTPITIEARGIGWRQLENSWLASYDNQFTGWISAVTTKGLARATIPATGTPGTHIVTVLHGDFTFPYLNMQQSPEPNRPMFHLPFTVTEGPAVLPPAPEKQVMPVKAGKAVDRGIWTEPQSGTVGDPIRVNGRALQPGARYTLAWTTMQGNRVANGYDQVTKDLATVETDKDGSFSVPVVVPNDLGGAHEINAKLGSVSLAKTEFLIQPKALALSKTHGPSGTAVDIRLLGVGWTETANIYNLTYDNGYAGYACGFNSGGDVTVKFVMSGERGWHYLDLYPGIYKGTETRPLNFRVPQLTYAADHPGEQLPAFRLAFLID